MEEVRPEEKAPGKIAQAKMPTVWRSLSFIFGQSVQRKINPSNAIMDECHHHSADDVSPCQ